MEIINPDEEPLDWDKGGKKRRPDNNPWHPPGKERNPYEKDPYPSGPFPGDPPNPDDDWPRRRPQDPNPYGPPGGPHKREDHHKRWEPKKKTTCPGCGGTGEVHEDLDGPWYGGPTSTLDTHRGQQFGRKGHFGSGTGQ